MEPNNQNMLQRIAAVLGISLAALILYMELNCSNPDCGGQAHRINLAGSCVVC